MFYHAYADKFFKLFDRIECGTLSVITPDQKERFFRGEKDGPRARIVISDWRTFTHFAAKGDIGLAEAYRDYWWDSDDLCALLSFGLANEAALTPLLHGNRFSNLTSRVLYALRQNTIKGSKKNIHDHYDLGNQFYSLWLDPTMTYSAALYRKDHDTLEQAQHNKYDRIIDRLKKKSGSVLEVGCGWGGFADRVIARNDNDYHVKGITLSEEQHKYARRRVQNQAEIALEDYRHQTGRYDNIVSIEMFEAVGEKYWPTYFSKLKSLLAQNGTAMIQTITIDDRHFERYRKGGDMIRTFIFPGGMLPSVPQFRRAASQAELRVNDEYAFGQDYAKTILAWLNAFDHNQGKIKALGYDDKFIRLWRFYLAACYAAFSVGRINVMHMELQHA